MFSWKIFISSNSALCALVANSSGPSLAHGICVCATQTLVWAKPKGHHRAAAPQGALCAWLRVVLHHR